jgi:hypothetical protein
MRTPAAVVTANGPNETEVRAQIDGACGGASRLDRVMLGRLSILLALSLAATAALPKAATAQRVPPDPRAERGPRLSDAPEAHIRDLRVTPGTVNARFEFRARSRLSAVLQLSANAPVRDAQGRWEFRTAVPVRRVAERAGTGVYEVVVGSLDPGRRYHYIVTLQGSDPRLPHQLTGALTTERLVADVATDTKLTESVGYHIRNVRVEPTATKVWISFQGRPDQVPIVEIARRAPRPNLDGRLELRDGLVGGYPMGGSPANGIYRIEVGGGVELEQGAEYHYLITVPSGSIRRPYQQAGTFRMQEQSVRVVLTAIEIRNDGNGGAGRELGFDLYVNQQMVRQVNGGRKLRLRTGGIHRIDEVAVLEHVPDSLSIRIETLHDDRDTRGLWAWTPARTTVDLARRPGLDPRPIYLMLVSENFHKGERLSYIVTGQLDIIRQ